MLFITPSCGIFWNVVLNKFQSFHFTQQLCESVLNGFSCSNVLFQWICIIFHTCFKLFGTFFESFTFLFYFCPWSCNWHNHLFSSECWSGFSPISKFKWWRNDIVFIFLDHLFNTFSWCWNCSYPWFGYWPCWFNILLQQQFY